MNAPTRFYEGRVLLYAGDCLDIMRTLPEASVDAIVTDPPYHLASIVKRFGAPEAAECRDYEGGTGAYKRASKGFMGKSWDGGDIAFRPETWALALRVLKPGGRLVAFAATRNQHRMFCAIEDAGFEIKDMIAWLYGSGFPKSHNLGGDWNGWGTALKPAIEPICFARKPIEESSIAANVLKHGTGAINIDGCRIPIDPTFDDQRLGGAGAWRTSKEQAGNTVSLPRGEVTSSPLGRWPANVVHDGSDEVVARFPESNSPSTYNRSARAQGEWLHAKEAGTIQEGFGDSGSAARFFYTTKADADDRLGSRHPTVKPLDLMRWLVRLVTPPGGLVLDPFAGTGSTGEAALLEGFRACLIERESEYQADIARRLDLALAGETARKSAIHRARPSKAAGPSLFDVVEAAE